MPRPSPSSTFSTGRYSTGERGIIDMVSIRYSEEYRIESVALQNFPADTVAVLVYFRIFKQFGTVCLRPANPNPTMNIYLGLT